jgi:hypothetical protein
MERDSGRVRAPGRFKNTDVRLAPTNDFTRFSKADFPPLNSKYRRFPAGVKIPQPKMVWECVLKPGDVEKRQIRV